MTTALRSLATLQALCVLAALHGDSSVAAAFSFRPVPQSSGGVFGSSGSGAGGQRLASTVLFSASSSPGSSPERSSSALSSTSGVVPKTQPSSPLVRVVAPAALVHGPAHAASLQSNNHNNGIAVELPGADRGIAKPAPATPRAPAETGGRPAPPSPPTANRGRTTRRAATRKTAAGNQKGPVAIVESVGDLLAVMDGKEPSGEATGEATGGSSNNDDDDDTVPHDGLTLVLFHAHYCKICQRATMQLVKAAREYPSVRFARVEARVFPEPASDHLRTLGVSKFPFVQLYRGGDCVASFSTGPTHMFMRKVRDTLGLCLERDEACWESFSSEFSAEIASNRRAREALGPALLP